MSEYPNIPLMAKGTIVPPYVYEKARIEEEQAQQLKDLKRIADSMQEQVKILENQMNLYKSELESAKKDLFFDRFLSIIAILISIIAIAAPLLL